MRDDDPREEVSMTAELAEDVTLRMPLSRGWTWADLQELPDDDGHRYEIVDGSLHVSPSPSRPHQVAASRLVRLLADAAPDEVEVVETVDVDMGDNVFEPDVVVLPAAAAYSSVGPLEPGQVLLAVEVVSRSSRRMDRLVKPAVLAEAGVPAYWRVELDGPEAPFAVLYELDGDVYREVASVSAGDVVLVDRPFPVQLRPAELVGPRRRD
jgi:Uma2 family endonuclease